MERRIDWRAISESSMLVARALGFVFLVYFIPVILRDAPSRDTGGALIELLTGSTDSPWIPLAFVLGSLAISVAFVLLYARKGRGRQNEPRPLLSFDGPAVRRWALGFGIGAAIIVLGHVILAGMGVLRVDGLSSTIVGRPPARDRRPLLTLLAESLREELAFRGPSQRDLSRVIGFPFAAVFFSASFTLLHLARIRTRSRRDSSVSFSQEWRSPESFARKEICRWRRASTPDGTSRSE